LNLIGDYSKGKKINKELKKQNESKKVIQFKKIK
jgi:hypothetical protein